MVKHIEKTDILDKHTIILASKSPRRHELLKNCGITFSIEVRETEEIFPKNIQSEEIAQFLAKQKADAFKEDELEENVIVITADTIVLIDDIVLGKPNDFDQAKQMLEMLSGRKHQVITGVCIKSAQKCKSFAVTTDVFFKNLSSKEIEYYINEYEPYDKAGSYGIQEWIGHIGIEKIIGSFYNVMGLPTQRLCKELEEFYD